MVELVCDPALFGKKQPEILAAAEAAGLDQRSITRAMRSSYVHDAIHEVGMRRVGQALPAILAATVESALIPGKEGHFDRKILLEMVGLYNPKAPGESFRRIIGGEDEAQAEDGEVLSIADELSKVNGKRIVIEEETRRAKITVTDADGASRSTIIEGELAFSRPEDVETPGIVFPD